MQTFSLANWQARRAELSREWLGGRYLPELDRWLEHLSQDQEYLDLEQRFLTCIFPEWRERQPDIVALLRGFDPAQVTQSLVGATALGLLPVQTRNWLEPVIRPLLRARYPTSQWLVDAFLHIQAADAASDRINRVLANSSSARPKEKSRLLLPLFRALRDSSWSLYQTLEGFAQVRIN